MNLRQAFVFLVLSASLVIAQQRVKPKAPKDFAQLHAAIKTTWEAGEYGQCLAHTRDLMSVVTRRRTEAILAAMPVIDGYEKVPPRKQDEASNAMLAALSASVGNIVEQVYRPVGGGQNLTLKVTSDSPLLQMFDIWIANPAMLGEGAELIEYTGYKGVLQKQGNGHSLQVKVGKDIIEASVKGKDEDFLLGILSQKVVDNLVTTLAN